MTKMKKATWIVFCLVLMATSVFSQRDETVFGRSGLRISGVWGGSTTNFTEIGDDLTLLSGGYGGLEFNKTVFIGWGGYGGGDDITIGQETKDLDIYYTGPIVSFTPAAWKVVHPKITFMGGSGRMRLDNGNRDRIGVFQPSGGLEINIFRWCRVGAEAGYRFITDVRDDQLVNNKDLSGLFGEVKLKFGWSWGR